MVFEFGDQKAQGNFYELLPIKQKAVAVAAWLASVACRVDKAKTWCVTVVVRC